MIIPIISINSIAKYMTYAWLYEMFDIRLLMFMFITFWFRRQAPGYVCSFSTCPYFSVFESIVMMFIDLLCPSLFSESSKIFNRNTEYQINMKKTIDLQTGVLFLNNTNACGKWAARRSQRVVATNLIYSMLAYHIFNITKQVSY